MEPIERRIYVERELAGRVRQPSDRYIRVTAPIVLDPETPVPPTVVVLLVDQVLSGQDIASIRSLRPGPVAIEVPRRFEGDVSGAELHTLAITLNRDLILRRPPRG